MEPERRKKLPVFLPWALLFAVLVAAILYILINRQSSSPLETSVRKVELLATMRIHLLEAIEAEKNAVLAITDEASKEFAERARQAAGGVEKSRKEIESIIYQWDGDDENGDGNGETKDPLTAEEATHLLTTVSNDLSKPYPLSKHYPIFFLLLRTGMRVGEAFALQWSDIDFNGRFIHIVRGLSRKKIETPKSGRTRRVDMTPHLAETLFAYRVECRKKGLALGLGDAPELVFTNNEGGFIDLDNWRRRVFNRALRKAGLRRIRIHDLRHTYATLRISKGDNIADVAGQLGHADATMTLKIYYHWLPGGKKSEVDALDSLGSHQKQRKAQNEG